MKPLKLIALKSRTKHGKTIHIGESFRVDDAAEARKLVDAKEAKYLPGQEPATRAPAQEAAKA